MKKVVVLIAFVMIMVLSGCSLEGLEGVIEGEQFEEIKNQLMQETGLAGIVLDENASLEELADLDEREEDQNDQIVPEDRDGESIYAREISGYYDIEFVYQNYIYEYELTANWNHVPIYESGFSLYGSYGLEILLDGTRQAFEDTDLDGSETITSEEWGDMEAEIPLSSLDSDNNGSVDYYEFEVYVSAMDGLDLYPDFYWITDPEKEEYYVHMEEDASPVSIKILRAGEGGYRAGSGIEFPEGTIFFELASEYTVYLDEMPYFELAPGYLTPLMSMYLEEDYEANNHGALGYSSVVDKEQFQKIYQGEEFELQYQGRGDRRILDEYHITIRPSDNS